MNIVLAVEGMKCGGCATHVEEALSRVPGVRRVEVLLEEGRARVSADEDTGVSSLIEAVRDAGYETTAGE